MRSGLAVAFALTIWVACVSASQAQEVPPAPSGTILTIEPERLISDTAYGQAVQGRLDAAAAALSAENRQIDADLELEEVALTARRDSLPAVEFRALAEAFDTKVEKIRSEQEGKGRALSQTRELERQKVLQAAVPILAELMAQRGAVAILDKASVFVAFDRADVTNDAIARLNTVLGDGTSAAPDKAGDPPPAAPPGPAMTP